MKLMLPNRPFKFSRLISAAASASSDNRLRLRATRIVREHYINMGRYSMCIHDRLLFSKSIIGILIKFLPKFSLSPKNNFILFNKCFMEITILFNVILQICVNV